MDSSMRIQERAGHHGFGKRLPQGDIRIPSIGRREEIPPFQIGCLGQDEICVEVAFVEKWIHGNMERNFSFILKDVRNQFRIRSPVNGIIHMSHQNPEGLGPPGDPDKKVLGLGIHSLRFWRFWIRRIERVTLGKEEAPFRIETPDHGIEEKNRLLV
jgi:hypothetical protein